MLSDHQFIIDFNALCQEFYANSVAHGFWENNPSNGEKIALIHSELSEALEGFRLPVLAPDKHCPEHLNVTIELADAIIRIGDLAARHNLPLAEALLAKHNFNKSRPHKHGKQF